MRRSVDKESGLVSTVISRWTGVVALPLSRAAGGVPIIVLTIALFVSFDGLSLIDAARAANGCAPLVSLRATATGAFGKPVVGASAVLGLVAPLSPSPAAAANAALFCVSTLPVVVFAAVPALGCGSFWEKAVAVEFFAGLTLVARSISALRCGCSGSTMSHVIAKAPARTAPDPLKQVAVRRSRRE